MRKLLLFFSTFFLFLFLVSCTTINEEVTKSNTNSNNTSSVIEFGNDRFIKQSIERVKKEEEEKKKKEIELWRAEHLLATATTVFNPNEIERTTNIRLATNYINGLVLNSNDTFSFNNIVGQRTLERGFLPADVYVSTNNGVITIQSPGGGICQVSSTICMAVLKTNMEIIERKTHSKEVPYAYKDEEAMINWGTSDFIFKNNYCTPVQIEILFVPINENEEQIICNIFSL